MKSSNIPGFSPAKIVAEIAEKCSLCSACRQDCAFLRKYGLPGELAISYDPADKAFQSIPFECSLCQLCSVVCPEQLNPAELFLQMRREKMRRAPSLGIILDCCMKISHDLGREEYFRAMFQEMHDFLVQT